MSTCSFEVKSHCKEGIRALAAYNDLANVHGSLSDFSVPWGLELSHILWHVVICGSLSGTADGSSWSPQPHIKNTSASFQYVKKNMSVPFWFDFMILFANYHFNICAFFTTLAWAFLGLHVVL